MSRSRSAVEAALLKKGFEKEEGDHSYFYYLDTAGKRTAVFTKTSHGTKYRELGDPLLAAMAGQCRLSKQQFFQLVDCTLSADQYRAKLKALGIG